MKTPTCSTTESLIQTQRFGTSMMMQPWATLVRHNRDDDGVAHDGLTDAAVLLPDVGEPERSEEGLLSPLPLRLEEHPPRSQPS